MAAVFITNAMLTQWSDQGKVRLDDTTLTLLQENRTVKLKAAVRFTKVIDGAKDPNGLLGKVKTPEQLTEIGAEHYLDSVILGEVGYQVVEGFLGDLSPASAGAVTQPPRAGKPEAPAHKPAPAPVETSPPPVADEPLVAASEKTTSDLEKEAQELSKLFLTTVRDR